METGVGVKPTLAHIGNAGVVGTSSRLDSEFTAVRQDKGATSRGHNKMLVKLHRVPAIARHVHCLRNMDNAMWWCLVSTRCRVYDGLPRQGQRLTGPG